MSLLKKAKCPNCGYEKYVITTNKYEKKTECSECGNVRDLEIID